ncbi:hypothetical protein QPK32_07365 [Massilia sp. YIM B02763]|uniref:hypothetical protein n=1 Tax=Massilia sp. YIM B02763 TaxID=3050130 RepID=UPI0025B6C2DB|nr:hypothetical protein [Massilia sp. YIM B02763]MDN4052891.1 hypothetical protein [Massilia sp. YIM B02763]
MPDLNILLIYRDRIMRAVVGTRPAIMAKEADTAALDRICQGLADGEEAKQLLCAKGYGFPSQSLADLVRKLPSVKP